MLYYILYSIHGLFLSKCTNENEYYIVNVIKRELYKYIEIFTTKTGENIEVFVHIKKILG